jgi:hypothetical protein
LVPLLIPRLGRVQGVQGLVGNRFWSYACGNQIGPGILTQLGP